MSATFGFVLRESWPVYSQQWEQNRRRPCGAPPKRTGKRRIVAQMPTEQDRVIGTGYRVPLATTMDGDGACCTPAPPIAERHPRGCGIARLGRRAVCDLPAGKKSRTQPAPAALTPS